jgi:hypothetical protein
LKFRIAEYSFESFWKGIVEKTSCRGWPFLELLSEEQQHANFLGCCCSIEQTKYYSRKVVQGMLFEWSIIRGRKGG